MPKDFEQMLKNVLDAERQWKKEMDQASKGLSTTKLHDTSASTIAGFEKLEAIETESAQRKIDSEKSNIQTAETLQQMNGCIQNLQEQMLQQQTENAKQSKASKIRELVTIILAALSLLATVAIGAISILLQLRQQ